MRNKKICIFAIIICLALIAICPLQIFAVGVIDVDAKTSLTIDYHYEDVFIANAAFSAYKIADIDAFYPDRLADRILGMGDVVSLVEKAQEEFDMEQSAKLASRLMSGKFTLDDMLISLEQTKKLGPLSSIMGMIPGMGDFKSQINDETADKAMKVTKAVIQSMTLEERKDPTKLRGTHKRRIAAGSGTSVDDVNRVINQYEKTKKIAKSFSSLTRGMF